MKKLAYAVVLVAGVAALSACGKSDKAGEEAQAENVEMPAEEAMQGVDAAAAPVADASATASDAAAAPDAGASAAAEQAVTDAEKKM